MAKEIERKFLVDKSKMGFLAGITPIDIKQGYLAKVANATVRVRIADHRGFLTIKGRSVGIVCDEHEYEVPVLDAIEMLCNNCTGMVIVKKRYEVPVGAFVFEVDVFEGPLAGLIVAEVELPTEDTVVVLPDWVGEEVSTDHRYKNSVLSDKGMP